MSASLSSFAPEAGVTLPPEIQKHLGNLLKASYNEVLTAPVPDRFIQLLEQLDQEDRVVKHQQDLMSSPPQHRNAGQEGADD